MPFLQAGFEAPYYKIEGPHRLVSTSGVRAWEMPDHMVKAIDAIARQEEAKRAEEAAIFAAANPEIAQAAAAAAAVAAAAIAEAAPAAEKRADERPKTGTQAGRRPATSKDGAAPAKDAW